MTRSLPPGFTVRLNRSVRSCDGGGTLVGGSPTRVLFLTAAATAMVDGRTVSVRDEASCVLVETLIDAGMADPLLGALPAVPIDTVTVVVPARDRADALGRLLDSIPSGIRVIVVDDCSLRPAPVAAAAAARTADLVVLTRNLGPAGARNAGLALVDTPFVAFLDSDTAVNGDTLSLLLRHFADPRVALVAPRILGLDRRRANWIGRYEDARSSLDMGNHPSLVRPLSPVAWLPAACMVARVEALGVGFGAGMRVAEDVDLVWRLAEEGWRIRYEPAASAYHEHRASLLAWLARKAFYGTGAELLARRHPHNIAPAVLAPWSVAMLLALVAQRRWSVPLALALAGVASGRITAKVRRAGKPVNISVHLTASGAVSAVFQASALLLRHWWPLTAAACLVSKRMRRATLAAALADVAMEYARTRPRIDPLRFAVLRRLDDLAYGAGLWWGVLRGRSAGALIPTLRGAARHRSRPLSMP